MLREPHHYHHLPHSTPAATWEINTKINLSEHINNSPFEYIHYSICIPVSGVKPVSEAADDLSYMMSSPLMHIESFLEALTNANKDGRIVINKQGNILTRLVMKREHSRRTGSVQWLLMPWLLMSPDQQQPWLFWGCTVHRPAREYKVQFHMLKSSQRQCTRKTFMTHQTKNIRHLSDGLGIFYANLWNLPSDIWA